MKGIIFYTDNRIKEPIKSEVRRLLQDPGLPVTSASLKPMEFGNNEVISEERGYTTMVKQIISCLERSEAKYVFFCEHDVLYHPRHFDFTPPKDDIFYYNENTWRWLLGGETAIRHDRMLSLSSLCVDREFALDHYKRRLKRIEEKGWDKIIGGEPKWARAMGYEPGTKKKKRGGLTNDDFEIWQSENPIIDIRHNKTFSPPKNTLDSFKHKPTGWEEISIDNISCWDLRSLCQKE